MGVATPAGLRDQRAPVWLFAFAVGSIFAAAASRFPVNDSDLFWHLATGRWMVEHGQLARVDTFSSTAVGAPLPLDQWLGQLVLWASYALGSWWGVLALRTVVVAAIATLVLQASLARAPRAWIGALSAFPGLALSRFVWGDRPELLGLLCFVAFLSLALAARRGDRRALVALPPLFAAWANLHGGFVVGVALLIVLSVEVALFARELARRFLAATALSIAATLLNPAFLGVYESPGWHFLNPPRFIQEWGVPDVTTFAGALYAVTLLGTLGAALLARGGGTTWAALLVPLAFLSLTALRHLPLFALAAAPYLSETLTRLTERFGLKTAASAGRVAPLPLAAFGVIVLAASLATAPREPDLRGFPLVALVALRGEPGALLNEYDWGGFLIWEVPDHPVFIDGRLRPYVGVVLDDYATAIGVHPGWREVLDRRGVGLVLVRPSGALAVRLREAGWATLAVDDDAVLLRRPLRASSPFGGERARILAPDVAERARDPHR